MTLDPYLVLGISTTCEDVVIRAAYKALMIKYHPDTNKNNDATAHAADINKAFSILGDPLRRKEYDARQRDVINNSYLNRSANPFFAPQKTRLTTLKLASHTIAKAAKAGWVAVGGSIVAAVIVSTAILTENDNANQTFFFEILMSNAYAIGRDNIEAISPLSPNIKDVMCNISKFNKFKPGTYCPQYNLGESFYGTLVFGNQ